MTNGPGLPMIEGSQDAGRTFGAETGKGPGKPGQVGHSRGAPKPLNQPPHLMLELPPLGPHPVAVQACLDTSSDSELTTIQQEPPTKPGHQPQ